MVSEWSEVLETSVQYLRLTWCDAAGIRRCRVIPRRRLAEVAEHGVGLASACFWLPAWGDCCLTDDPAGVPVGEVRLVPDITATRVLPWMPSHATALVSIYKQPPDEPWKCCPRSVLKRVLAQAAEQHGLTLKLGFELEFYLLHKPGHDSSSGSGGSGSGGSNGGAASTAEQQQQQQARVPAPIDHSNYCSSSAFDAAAPVLGELCSTLSSLGISVEQLHAESGPGQFELALAHASPLEAADSLLFAKEAVAAVAAKHGMVASFLPKLFEGSASSGLHLHFSLWEGGSNLLEHDLPRPKPFIFAGTDDPAVPGLSRAGEAFLAGLLAHLPALMAFTTPAPNSYRRLQPHAWAGAYQCFGVNNREAPLRLCATPGVPEAANCELKAFDGTTNPHLGAAAAIAAGLLGVQQNLRLPQPAATDPGSLSDAGREAAGIARLPSTLGEAIAAYEADEEFQAALAAAFGCRTLPRAFLATRRSEWRHFEGMGLEEEAALLHARY